MPIKNNGFLSLQKKIRKKQKCGTIPDVRTTLAMENGFHIVVRKIVHTLVIKTVRISQ